MLEKLLPAAVEAGIDPIAFWDMTFGEIAEAIEGYHNRCRFNAIRTFYICKTFAGNDCPQINVFFPGLFDELPQKQSWEAIKERVLAHSEDYKRNGGEKL